MQLLGRKIDISSVFLCCCCLVYWLPTVYESTPEPYQDPSSKIAMHSTGKWQAQGAFKPVASLEALHMSHTHKHMWHMFVRRTVDLFEMKTSRSLNWCWSPKVNNKYHCQQMKSNRNKSVQHKSQIYCRSVVNRMLHKSALHWFWMLFVVSHSYFSHWSFTLQRQHTQCTSNCHGDYRVIRYIWSIFQSNFGDSRAGFYIDIFLDFMSKNLLLSRLSSKSD